MYQAIVPSGVPGAVLAIHTSGEALNHNPHIHGMVANGVFLSDGLFKPVPKLAVKKLTKLFQHKVLSALKRKGLVSDTVISQLISQKHSGFSAWLGELIEPDDANQRLFVAKYIDRGPVANSRIEISGDIISYHHDSDYLPAAEFDPLEFLAALSVHVPRKWEQLTRHYGYYSTRSRGERKKKQASSDPVILEPVDKRKASSIWAALIKKVYLVDPLICSRCGGEMKIVAFILDPKEIDKIVKHLGLPKYRAPPPIKPTIPSEPHYEPFFEAA